VAKQALAFPRLVGFAQLALVNGAAGIVSWRPGGKPFSIMGFTIASGKIVVFDTLADPERLSRLDWGSPR
jgi:RNA polymerase sigma-70 factor (ECF subfamily)